VHNVGNKIECNNMHGERIKISPPCFDSLCVISRENIHQLDVHKIRSVYTDRACLLRSNSQAISKILNDQNSKRLHGYICFIRNNVHSAVCATVCCSRETEIHCSSV